MGTASKIAWTNDTFSPWHGCVEVSPACDHCYARTFDARFYGGDSKPPAHWGKDAPRRFFGDRHWNDPIRWNKLQTAARSLWERGLDGGQEHRRVFCASMADVFESYTGPDTVALQIEDARTRLWNTIRATPALTWMLLTKRPQNIGRMAPADIREAPHVWFGTTIESPEYLWRAKALRDNAPRAPVRFVSMEPLVAETSIEGELERGGGGGINWVITGCESGDGARPTPSAWYRRLRDECRGRGQAFFLKQAPRGSDGITSGPGSWIKLKDGLVEQPYLDGKQHIAFPIGRAA